MIFLIITIFLLVPYGLLILYFRKSWIEIPVYTGEKKVADELPFISIIIAARNEEKNIGECIQSIVNQTYPGNKFEIIITDDHSTDNTVSIIRAFQNEISA